MAEQLPSGVWLNQDDTLERERLDREEKYRAYQSRVRARVQFLIVDALVGLQRRLGELEQTTHSHPCGRTIQSVLRLIQECWDDPTALQVSNLSQEIEALLAEWSKT